MSDLPSFLISGERPRLIPVVADSNKEGRAVSVLLGTLVSVPGYAKAMFSGLGQRVGSRATLTFFTEVVFARSPIGTIRPDGLVILKGGAGRSWKALIEAKISRAELGADQVSKYCQLAKANGIDAVVTVSNQFAALPSHHPVSLNRAQSKGIALFHWSWMHVLTEALLLLNDDAFDSKEQRFILEESVRYFSHPSVGVSTFSRMNAEWRDVVMTIQAGGQLSKNSPEVENSVAAWHQETRDLSLLMSRTLGRKVSLGLSRAHAGDPGQRLKDDTDHLVAAQELYCVLDVPDAAASIRVTANLARRSVICRMSLAAPKDKKRAGARINWILRQLDRAEPDGIFVKVKWPGRAADTQASLVDARSDSALLEAENRKLVPQAFEVLLVKDLMGKFSGVKTFVEHVEAAVPAFYNQVGQHLRAWVATPPKMPPSGEPSEDGSESRRKSEAAVPAVVIESTPPQRL